jgi:hypothetical protein
VILEKVRSSVRGIRERRREEARLRRRREEAIRPHADPAADDVAYVVHASIDDWAQLDPKSMYWALRLRGLI